MDALAAGLAQLAAALAPTTPGGAAEVEQVEPFRLGRGTVIAVNAGTPGSVDISTDGNNTRASVPFVGVAPSVGDDVWVLQQTPYLLVLGPSGDA